MFKVIPFAVKQNNNLIPIKGIINSAVTTPIFPIHVPENVRKLARVKRFLLENNVEGALRELGSVVVNIGA